MVTLARKELTDFMAESQKSQKQISKEIGISSAVISQFLSGVYNGDNEEIADKILQYVRVAKARQNTIKIPEFCETLHNAEQVLFAASYAHSNNDIALIYGDAGAGKTMALKHYAKMNPGVIYITANASSRTARAMLYLITEALGKTPVGTEFIMMRNLVEMLKGTNRLIIIDEADHLTAHALQSIRNLNDEAGVGLVFSGNDIIKLQMYGRGSLQFDQLRTRIGPKKKVSNSYTLQEMQCLFPFLNDECIAYLTKIANKESLRTAIKRYVFAMQFSNMNEESLTIKCLRETEAIQYEGSL